MSLQIYLPGNPPTTTAQTREVHVVKGKPVFYDPPQLLAAKQQLQDRLIPHIPDAPYDSAIRLIVKWCFPRGSHEHGTYKTTKPDTDNLQKLLKDVMTSLHFWLDDALVASEIIEKFWTDKPGIFIRIEELTPS